MRAFAANQIVSGLIGEAQQIGPRDPLTRYTYILRSILNWLTLPILFVIPMVTFVLGLIVMVSFGLLLLPLSIIWWPFFGFVLGSSWLWLKAWYLRPFLLIPGIVVSVIGNLYVSLVPDMGEKYQKVLKMGFCDSWPYSYLVWQLSLQVSPEEVENL